MSVSYRYLHYDVFTDRRFTGNQLAVFPEARNLDGATMQRIAAEMAFSESTFILPPDDVATDARMRIFTPRAELPMAGHPTVGSTFALAHEGVIAADRKDFVFGLGIGPTPVELEWSDGRLAFVWMTQPVPELGAPVGDAATLAAALGLERADVARGTPPQVVSSGVPMLFVALASRAAVDQATLERSTLRGLLATIGHDELPVFIFSLEPGDDGASAYSRMFAPTFGIAEDPATGGASGPLGGYLVHHGAVPRSPVVEIISHQGVAMGRPSRIHISIESSGSSIARVLVGGESVLVAEGTLFV